MSPPSSVDGGREESEDGGARSAPEVMPADSPGAPGSALQSGGAAPRHDGSPGLRGGAAGGTGRGETAQR
eukprot:9695155-Alexandrium_andersonii.AAC.1